MEQGLFAARVRALHQRGETVGGLSFGDVGQRHGRLRLRVGVRVEVARFPDHQVVRALDLDDVAVRSFKQVLRVSRQFVNETWAALTGLGRLAANGLFRRGRVEAVFWLHLGCLCLWGAAHQFGWNKEVWNFVRSEDVAVGGGFALLVAGVALPGSVSLHRTADLLQQPHLLARSGRDVKSALCAQNINHHLIRL